VAFGPEEGSSVALVASAKAAENFSDGPAPPTEAFAGVALMATGGKLTITVSPQPPTDSARRWPEQFRLETLAACEVGSGQLKSFHDCADEKGRTIDGIFTDWAEFAQMPVGKVCLVTAPLA
jgi:hypothetical protein